MLNLFCFVWIAGGSMPGQEEDISPYATFHLLGMREEAKNGTTYQIALKTPNPKCRLFLKIDL